MDERRGRRCTKSGLAESAYVAGDEQLGNRSAALVDEPASVRVELIAMRVDASAVLAPMGDAFSAEISAIASLAQRPNLLRSGRLGDRDQ